MHAYACVISVAHIYVWHGTYIYHAYECVMYVAHVYVWPGRYIYHAYECVICVAHMYVWHGTYTKSHEYICHAFDAFKCVVYISSKSHVHMCHVTRTYVPRIWCIHMRGICLCHVTRIYVPCHTYICAIPRILMRHVSHTVCARPHTIRCVPDHATEHIYVWQDSFQDVTWRINMRVSYQCVTLCVHVSHQYAPSHIQTNQATHHTHEHTTSHM